MAVGAAVDSAVGELVVVECWEAVRVAEVKAVGRAVARVVVAMVVAKVAAMVVVGRAEDMAVEKIGRAHV